MPKKRVGKKVPPQAPSVTYIYVGGQESETKLAQAIRLLNDELIDKFLSGLKSTGEIVQRQENVGKGK